MKKKTIKKLDKFSKTQVLENITFGFEKKWRLNSNPSTIQEMVEENGIID
jgi:hypothetical protein